MYHLYTMFEITFSLHSRRRVENVKGMRSPNCRYPQQWQCATIVCCCASWPKNHMFTGLQRHPDETHGAYKFNKWKHQTRNNTKRQPTASSSECVCVCVVCFVPSRVKWSVTVYDVCPQWQLIQNVILASWEWCMHNMPICGICFCSSHTFWMLLLLLLLCDDNFFGCCSCRRVCAPKEDGTLTVLVGAPNGMEYAQNGIRVKHMILRARVWAAAKNSNFRMTGYSYTMK